MKYIIGSIGGKILRLFIIIIGIVFISWVWNFSFRVIKVDDEEMSYTEFINRIWTD